MWRQLLNDLYRIGEWLQATFSPLLERIANWLFAITKPAAKARLYVRDGLILALIGWILFRHWDIVGVTGFASIRDQVGGSWVAKLLGVMIVGVPLYFLKVVLVFFLPDSLRTWLFWMMPYFLARYAASRYLEDIYEISDALQSMKEGLKVAQEFLLRAAFARGYGRVRERKTFPCRLLLRLRPVLCPTEEECLNWGRSRQYGRIKVSLARRFWDFLRGAPTGCPHTLAIVDGEVKDRRSPLLLIGGPGYVFISTDSAALFEKPDGTPRVLGPTTRRLHLIEGFERVRRIVSLRDHQITLSVNARSRDGLPIDIKDVQLLFGIYRGGRKLTTKEPYPFAKMALDHLVYGERAGTGSERRELLSSSRLLTNAMRNMARSELANFIRSQTVVEFLASVSYGDLKVLEEEYQQIKAEMVLPQASKAEKISPPPLPAPPDFVWRPEIGARFDQMVNEGADGRRALQRGVGLQWIGLGAWHTPVTSIIDSHLEAWKISVGNMLRSAPGVLAQLERERQVSFFAERVRTMLGKFQNEAAFPSSWRQVTLLRYFVNWLEWGALVRYGGIAHAPAAWRSTATYLRSLLPRANEENLNLMTNFANTLEADAPEASKPVQGGDTADTSEHKASDSEEGISGGDLGAD